MSRKSTTVLTPSLIYVFTQEIPMHTYSYVISQTQILKLSHGSRDTHFLKLEDELLLTKDRIS